MDNERHFVEPCAVDAAVDYLEAGFALVEIVPGTKGPTTKGWNLRENVWESDNLSILNQPLIDAFGDDRRGMGLAHAYAGTMALDIDDWDTADRWLADRGVDLQALWDAPDAVHLLSGRAGRGKLLYRLPRGPITTKQPAGSGLELRCADSRGGTVQDVLPPSIHPATGKPYYWGGAGDWRDLPLIPPELLQAWLNLVAVKPKEAAALADVGAFEGSTGVYSVPAIWNVIDKIDPDSEYPLWIRVGMAIHDETSGEEAGYEIFDQWSQKGTKYAGPEQTRAKWDSFQGSDRPVTLAGLTAHGEPAPIDAFEDLGPPTAEEQPVRFRARPSNALVAGAKPEGYFIKGVMPRAGLGVLYGASGSGKSFLMLDMALAIALGIPWRGHKVRQARVMYVVTEGKASFYKRLEAYRQFHGRDLPDALLIINEKTPSFSEGKADARTLARDVITQGGADLIIIDTLSQTIAGEDENASATMSRVAKYAGELSQATGATVLFVHHSGKDESKGSRGHSSLRAACDMEFALTYDESSQIRTLAVTKSKDDIGGEKFYTVQKSVEIGTDEDGDKITSCVCDEAMKPVAAPPPVRGLPGRVKETIQALAFENIVPLEVVVNELLPSIDRGDSKKDKRRDHIVRGVMALQEKGLLKLNDGVITWL